MRFFFCIISLVSCLCLSGCGEDVGRANKRPPLERTDQGAEADESLILSQIHRDRGAPPLSYAEEIKRTLSNGLPSALYRAIPDQETDDEGSKVFTRTTLGRPSVSCGLNGAFNGIDARIADCSAKNSNKAFWNGSSFGVAGEGNWQLVSLSEAGEELWMDNRTGMIWSDLRKVNESTSFNWCKASGNDQGATPTIQTNCQELSQGESLCSGLVMDGIGEQIRWRLPTRNDFLLADLNGLRFVLKGLNSPGLWTATISAKSPGRTKAWVYHPAEGTLSAHEQTELRQVRCIGSPVR